MEARNKMMEGGHDYQLKTRKKDGQHTRGRATRTRGTTIGNMNEAIVQMVTNEKVKTTGVGEVHAQDHLNIGTPNDMKGKARGGLARLAMTRQGLTRTILCTLRC